MISMNTLLKFCLILGALAKGIFGDVEEMVATRPPDRESSPLSTPITRQVKGALVEGQGYWLKGNIHSEAKPIKVYALVGGDGKYDSTITKVMLELTVSFVDPRQIRLRSLNCWGCYWNDNIVVANPFTTEHPFDIRIKFSSYGFVVWINNDLAAIYPYTWSQSKFSEIEYLYVEESDISLTRARLAGKAFPLINNNGHRYIGKFPGGAMKLGQRLYTVGVPLPKPESNDAMWIGFLDKDYNFIFVLHWDLIYSQNQAVTYMYRQRDGKWGKQANAYNFSILPHHGFALDFLYFEKHWRIFLNGEEKRAFNHKYDPMTNPPVAVKFEGPMSLDVLEISE